MTKSTQPREEDLVPDPKRDWDSEKRDKDPSPGDHRPYDHSGGSSIDHGDITGGVVTDAADDPEDHKRDDGAL